MKSRINPLEARKFQLNLGFLFYVLLFLGAKTFAKSPEFTVKGEGAEKVMVMNVRPVTNNKLSEPLALMAIEDITEILATNKLLAATNSELAENNTQLATFNSIASHDLQEPLRKIQTFASRLATLDEQNISANARSYLARIEFSAKKMQNLIGGFKLNLITESKVIDFSITGKIQKITNILKLEY